MKNVFILLFITICSAACNQPENEDNEKADTTQSVILKVEQDVTKCMPRDTAVSSTGVFVKYVKYDNTYGLIVGTPNWQTKWRDDIDCSVPPSAVPKYEWSSDKVIALRNSCGGNFCSKHIYFGINSNIVYRRDNVIAHDSNNDLIAYFTDNYCLTIENIAYRHMVEYTINDSPACASYVPCVKNVAFAQGRLTFDMRLIRHKKELLETKSFSIPERLYKN